MPREKAQAAPTARPKVPMRRRGADCLVVVMKRGNARGAKGAGHRVELGPTGSYREEPEGFSGRRQPSSGGTSRMTRECQVRNLREARGEIPRAYSARSARVSQTRRHGHHERRSTGLLREKYLTRTGETVPHPGMSQGAPMTAFDYWIMERDNRIQRSVCSNCWHDTRLAALCRHAEIALFSESPPDRQR